MMLLHILTADDVGEEATTDRPSERVWHAPRFSSSFYTPHHHAFVCRTLLQVTRSRKYLRGETVYRCFCLNQAKAPTRWTNNTRVWLVGSRTMGADKRDDKPLLLGRKGRKIRSVFGKQQTFRRRRKLIKSWILERSYRPPFNQPLFHPFKKKALVDVIVTRARVKGSELKSVTSGLLTGKLFTPGLMIGTGVGLRAVHTLDHPTCYFFPR